MTDYTILLRESHTKLLLVLTMHLSMFKNILCKFNRCKQFHGQLLHMLPSEKFKNLLNIFNFEKNIPVIVLK